MKLGPGAKAVLMIAGVVIVGIGLRLAAPLLVPLVTAAFITVVSLPVVRWLTARKVPRWAAILLAVLLDVAVLVGVGGLVGGSINEFNERTGHYQARLAQLTVGAVGWAEAHGVHLDAQRLGELVGEAKVWELLGNLFDRVTTFLSKTLIVGLLVLFMLFEAGTWREKMAYVLRRPMLDLPRFDNAAREVQTYLVVKSALGVVTGALCGVWVAICGVDFALLWGLLAFFLNYIPTIGVLIATIPPALVALIQYGPGSALLVLSGYGVINFTLGNLVEPRIMGRALGLSPLVVFMSMVFWYTLWGPIGALLAVPLTMVMKIVMANTEDLRWAAVLLGSSEWFAQKKREWEDPFVAERRRSQLPPAPAAPPGAAAEPPPLEPNPPLHAEDAYEASGPRPRGGEDVSDEPDHEAARSA